MKGNERQWYHHVMCGMSTLALTHRKKDLEFVINQLTLLGGGASRLVKENYILSENMIINRKLLSLIFIELHID